MRFKERREKFRALIEGDRCVYPASVSDPISARIAEDIGFEAGMFAGSVASMAILGAPDHIVITMSEFAEQARRICRAGSLPLMVDADHCYGNALNVMRTVEELESAGICGMSVEDTELPMTYGSPREMSFTSIEEGVGKMKAAVAARRDPALVIAGRTNAVSRTGLDDAIARITAYEKTGVDMIMVIGVKTAEELEAISNAVSLPLFLGGVGPDINDLDYLSSRRVRLCVQGHHAVTAAYQAVHDTMTALRDGTKPKDLPNIPSSDFMQRVTRRADYDQWIDDFLGGN